MMKLQVYIGAAMFLLVGAVVYAAFDQAGAAEAVVAAIAGLAAGFCSMAAAAAFGHRAQAVQAALQANAQAMAGIAADHQRQMVQVAEQLKDFTDRLTLLVERKLNEEFEMLHTTRQEVAASLEGFVQLHEVSDKREEAHAAALEKTSNDLAQLIALQANKLGDKLLKQQADWAKTAEELVEDIKDDLDGAMKKQKEQLVGLLEQFVEHERGVQEELRRQASRHEEQLQVMKTLQDDVLGVSRQDAELLSKLLHKG